MADTVTYLGPPDNIPNTATDAATAAKPVKLKDNGDGTYTLYVEVQGIVANVDLDMEASDLGAGAAAADCGVGVTQHIDNGSGKRVAAKGDSDGHAQVDVLSCASHAVTVASGGIAAGGLAADSIAAGAAVDGADLTQGAIADAAVVAGATGSISAKLRSISRDIGTLLGKVAGAAFGTAGTPSADVVSVQGVSGAYPLPVDLWVPNGTEADQALTVDATAGGVQFAAFHANTVVVEFDVQVAQIRYTLDSSAPTSTNGHILEPGTYLRWHKTRAAAAKFIRTGSTSAVIHCSQLKGV